MQKKKGKIRKILLSLVMRVNEDNKVEFFNFLGELLRYNADFFVDYGYYPLLPKMKKFFTDEQFMEMEQYIINNFCLGTQEKILTSFNAVAVIHEDKFVGRMYLTNMRIIGLGTISEKKSSAMAPTHGIIRAAISASKDSKRKHIRRALRQRMGGEDILFFGHQVPINEAYKIKKSSGAIVYLVNLTEEKKNRIKVRKLKLKIAPKPMRKEPGKEFKVRRVEILNLIEQALYDLQKPTTVAPESPTITTQTSDSSQNYCPYCGKQIEIGAKFCQNCGSTLMED